MSHALILHIIEGHLQINLLFACHQLITHGICFRQSLTVFPCHRSILHGICLPSVDPMLLWSDHSI